MLGRMTRCSETKEEATLTNNPTGRDDLGTNKHDGYHGLTGQPNSPSYGIN